jgi:anti-sigma regulatory factor (Ser/Thr protein kinase)
MTDRNPHPGPRAVRLTVQDEPAEVAEVRRAVDRIGVAAGLSDDALFGLKVAATEAVANALRHPGAGDTTVEVTIAAHEEALEVEVANAGEFRIRDGGDPEHGRGLPLMLALADEVEFAASPHGTRVRLRMRLEPHAVAA